MQEVTDGIYDYYRVETLAGNPIERYRVPHGDQGNTKPADRTIAFPATNPCAIKFLAAKSGGQTGSKKTREAPGDQANPRRPDKPPKVNFPQITKSCKPRVA
jgi:hypothetical protein